MDEVRVNIGGAEMELRPISARQYLAARMEAERMSESFADDQVSKAVLLGASLLAKGLFYDGERIFTDGDEVIDALSADEIADTAGYIDLETEQKVKMVETAERVKNAVQISETFKTGSKADVVNVDQRVSKNEQKGIFTAYTDMSVKVRSDNFERSYSPRSDMQRVSDFFQRDSRRYDGIISSY